MHSGAPGFRLFMEEQEGEAVAAGGWQRAVADLDLLENCLWVRELDRETEMGSEIRLRQRWQRGTRTGLVSKGRKGRRSTKTPRWGLRRKGRT